MTSDNSYTKSLAVAAIPEKVFAALTEPGQVNAWWSAMTTTGSGENGGELRITFGTEERSTVMRVLAAHLMRGLCLFWLLQDFRERGSLISGGQLSRMRWRRSG